MNNENLSSQYQKEISALTIISEKNRLEFIEKAFPEIPLSEIHDKSQRFWKCSKEDIVGNLNNCKPLESIRKELFLIACYAFSNSSELEISKYFGCHPKTLLKAIKSCISLLKRESEFGYKIHQFINELMVRCPGRIEEFSKLDFSMLKIVMDAKPYLHILRRVLLPNNTSLKSLEWFKNANKAYAVFASSIYTDETKLIQVTLDNEPNVLFQMQAIGYRFTSYSDVYDAHKLWLEDKMKKKLKKKLKKTESAISELFLESKKEILEGRKNLEYKIIDYKQVIHYAFSIHTEKALSDQAYTALFEAKQKYLNAKNCIFGMIDCSNPIIRVLQK